MNTIFTLEQWLVAATKNLTPTAISSITKEITDHYQTSLEKYETRGISSIEAEGLAVRDLGDPEKSANKFVQVYLTRSEVEKIESMKTLGNLTLTITLTFAYGGLAFMGFLLAFSQISLIFDVISTKSFHFLNSHGTNSIRIISAGLMPILIFLLCVFDLFLIFSLKNKKLIVIFTRIKLYAIIFSVILVVIYSVSLFFTLKKVSLSSYGIPATLVFFAFQWMRNTYSILRKFANAPQRTPSI